MDTMRAQQIKQWNIQNACFPVAKIELENGKFGIVNRQTGKLISEVSQRYTLVPNEKVFMPFVGKFGIERLKTFLTYGGSKYYYAAFNTGRQFDLGLPGVPDLIDERLIVQNSYNKTKAFSFMFGAFRHVCTNGLYSGQAIIAYKKIHVGEIPVDAMVKTVLDSYQSNNFDLWRRFKNTPLSRDQEVALLNTFEPYEVKNEEADSAYYDWNSNKQINNRIKERAIALIDKPENVDNQRSAWGLYNQINRAIAATVDSRAQVNKVILGNRNAESYLSEKLSLN
jgi:hypothetical protein